MSVTERANVGSIYSNKPILIVGLGNPGRGYARHRHNVGFMVVDELSEESRSKWTTSGEKAHICKTEIESRQVVLVKPQTFMNLSGRAVARALDSSRADAAELIVVHDDLDLALGRVRIKVGGGDGGHRGIRSIADSLRFRDFVRVRLGIGRPPEGVTPEEFVLSSFLPEEQETRTKLVAEGCRAVCLILTEGVVAAQNVLHPEKRPSSA
jgi:peptidyl-tRNA hydrolase, PTH1 family